MPIARRPLGRTGLDVSVLGFGAMELRGARRGPEISDEEAGRVLGAVLDAGINFIDTSIDYGRSEELIGRFLAHRRDEFYLASKCGCAVGDGTVPFAHDYSPTNVRAGVEQSLRRLATDHLDLVQIHMSPSREELEAAGTAETLLELKDEGKIRFVGMSGTLPNLREHIEMGLFDAFQIPYSGLQREHEELISAAAEAGGGTVIRGGVAKGAPSAQNQQRDLPGLANGEAQRRFAASQLEELAGPEDAMAFLLRFTLTHPDLSTAIVGTRSPDHLRANIDAAARGPLPDDVYIEAKRRFAEAGSVPQ